MSHQPNHSYQFGPFRLDAKERQLWRGDQLIALQPKAFDLLLILVEHHGHLLEKDELLKTVWPDAMVEEVNLANNISILRKALGEGKNEQKFIETVPKRGYRFVAAVTSVAADFSRANGQAMVNDLLPISKPLLVSATSSPIRAWQSLGDSWISNNRRVLLMLPILLVPILYWVWGNKEQPGQTQREIQVTMMTGGKGETYSAALSPDGKFIAYAEQTEASTHLWLQQVASGQPIPIGSTLDERVLGITFSPDGQFIYYTTSGQQGQSGTLYRLPLLGGVLTKVLSGVFSAITFAPDGQRVAFLRNTSNAGETVTTSLVIADNNGGNERTILTCVGTERLEMMPDWSPDGKEIACALHTWPTPNSTTVWTLIGINVQSGATRLLTPQRWDGVGRIAWLSDGSGFVLAGTKAGESGTARALLWLVSQPDGTVRRLTSETGYAFHTLSLSQDMQTLLTVNNKRPSQIWAVPLQKQSGRLHYEVRDAVQLTRGSRDGGPGLLSVNDGRIVYGRRNGDAYALWQMRDDGGEPQQLTSDLPFLEELTAPVNGSFYVFATKLDGRSHLFRVERDGSNLRQLTNGASNEIDSDCTPDGSWIVYSSLEPSGKTETPRLWKIAAEGGTPERLTDYHAEAPHISPNGQWISFMTFSDSAPRWQVHVIPVTGGAPVKRFELADEANPYLGSQWTPDGQALTYLVTKNLVSNIWAQPVDGSAPYPLTNFTFGMIYRYAFGHAGKCLYLARGIPINEAVIIRNFR